MLPYEKEVKHIWGIGREDKTARILENKSCVSQFLYRKYDLVDINTTKMKGK